MRWVQTARGWIRSAGSTLQTSPRIGLALGGGFARGIAHVGVLRVLQREGIPVSCIAGVSAGAMVAAAYASGSTPDEIEAVARTMRFKDVARWTISRYGLAGSERMCLFLKRLLKTDRFEAMRIPLTVVASDLESGKPVCFRSGDVVLPIRASCAYPGLFTPIRDHGRWLVDGMVTMEVPASPLRQMGATHIISVALPNPTAFDAGSVFSVVNRCFQVMAERSEREWRRCSNLVISPEVGNIGWDGFTNCRELVEAGEKAAEAALPILRRWVDHKADPETLPLTAAPHAA
jgi:NTE family protein